MDGEESRTINIFLVVLISNALDDFQDGNIIQGLLRPITDVFGSTVPEAGQWVYAVLFGIVFGMITLKTQSVAMPAVVMILISPIMFFLLPTLATPMFYILLALSIVTTFYRIYTHPGG